ncbi:MAG: vWA domain-containing protein [Chloroflexota bacterium]
MPNRPGGELATRPLHFIWICDCSGSMAMDGKVQSLNYAIQNAIPDMQKIADGNPNADVLMRAIKFSNGAQWTISQPVKVADFKWQDLTADGVTDMGKALSMVAEQLKLLSDRGLPPVLVLISDGQPTDNFDVGLKDLMSLQWGKKAVRISIAIGEDADTAVLQKFIGNPEIKPLQANNSETLVNYIKWVSTAVLQSASSPASQSSDAVTLSNNVPIPTPPDAVISSPASDVW